MVPKVPSMREVARQAGVSHMTVSRVLNGSPNIRPETRQRVQDTITKMGYKPNNLARSLAVGRTRQIGLLIHAYSEYGPMSMLRSMYAAARDSGYIPISYMIEEGDTEELQEGLDVLVSRRADGVVLIAPRRGALEFLNSAQLPTSSLVITSAPTEDLTSTRATRVSIDQLAGGKLAVDHLIARGHQVIAHLAGPQDWFDAQARLRAWHDCMDHAGLPKSPVVFGDWSADSGYAAADEISQIPGVTAVFAANDQMALGLMHGLLNRGFRIPQDISIIGFDGQPDSQHFYPPLTTVKQDFDALGELGMQTLLEKLTDKAPSEARSRTVKPKLIVRSSVRSLP